MPNTSTGSVSINYGDFSHSESYSIILDAYADTTAGKVKNYNSCDRRVEDPAAGQEIDFGNIDEANIGLTTIKNMNIYGDLHIDINYSTSFAADLIIPAGGVNMIHPNCSADSPRAKCPLATISNKNVASVATNGVIVFDSGGVGDVPPMVAYMARASGGGSGTDNFIVKVSEENTGIVYELNGTTIKDLSTTSIYTSSTVVNLTPFVDYRCIVTEV